MAHRPQLSINEQALHITIFSTFDYINDAQIVRKINDPGLRAEIIKRIRGMSQLFPDDKFLRAIKTRELISSELRFSKTVINKNSFND